MRWLIVICFAIGCAPARVCPARPLARGAAFVWDVRGANGSMTLFGTHQVASEQDVPAAVWHALDAAELFVAEAEEGAKGETYEDSEQVRRALELPAWESLMKMLPDDDFIELRQRLDIASAALARMRPWVALSLLVKTVFTFPDPNMATALSDRAENRHLAMEYLDTWMLQTVFLEMTVDATDLRGALHDRNLACSVAAGADAYRSGIDALFIKRASGGPSTVTAEASAIATRERVWTDKLIGYLSRGKRVFVAIGVANIVGPTGIAARLQQAGFVVTRVE